MRMRFGLASLMVIASTVLLIAPARAAVIWSGDPAQGTSVFGILNCPDPGSITPATDEVKGNVWQYTKLAGDNRCESHGIKVDGQKYAFQNNSTYYFGWSSKLTNTVNNNATFQWKSYGQGMQQNYPVVLKMIDGHLSMLQRQPDEGGKIVWTSSDSINPGDWNSIVLGIYTSDDLTGGWVELYLNGVQQTFTDGSTRFACRTWDLPGYDDPKWGVYGAADDDVTNYIAGLKVGETYEDVSG